MRRDLYKHVRFGQIEAGVGDFTHEYRIHFRVELEILEDLYSLALGRRPVDVWLQSG